jgi:hypothetical protein
MELLQWNIGSKAGKREKHIKKTAGKSSLFFVFKTFVKVLNFDKFI